MSDEPIVPTPENPLYGVGTVAKMFDVTQYTVREWIDSGVLPARKVQGRWRIQHKDVVELANKEHG
jgi:excisionase family DNA binding protein